MYLDRLDMLCDYLMALRAKEERAKFNMEYWFYCGTASCALGHACTMPAFNKLGLSFNAGNPDAELYCPIYVDPVTGRVSAAFEAAADIFGLTQQTARYIFDGEQYDKPVREIEPIDVANRIIILLSEVRTFARLEKEASGD